MLDCGTSNHFSNYNIILTGHSLGGALAQMIGAVTGAETVTFNAYGIKDKFIRKSKNDIC